MFIQSTLGKDTHSINQSSPIGLYVLRCYEEIIKKVPLERVIFVTGDSGSGKTSIILNKVCGYDLLSNSLKDKSNRVVPGLYHKDGTLFVDMVICSEGISLEYCKYICHSLLSFVKTNKLQCTTYFICHNLSHQNFDYDLWFLKYFFSLGIPITILCNEFKVGDRQLLCNYVHKLSTDILADDNHFIYLYTIFFLYSRYKPHCTYETIYKNLAGTGGLFERFLDVDSSEDKIGFYKGFIKFLLLDEEKLFDIPRFHNGNVSAAADIDINNVAYVSDFGDLHFDATANEVFVQHIERYFSIIKKKINLHGVVLGKDNAINTDHTPANLDPFSQQDIPSKLLGKASPTVVDQQFSICFNKFKILGCSEEDTIDKDDSLSQFSISFHHFEICDYSKRSNSVFAQGQPDQPTGQCNSMDSYRHNISCAQNMIGIANNTKNLSTFQSVEYRHNVSNVVATNDDRRLMYANVKGCFSSQITFLINNLTLNGFLFFLWVYLMLYKKPYKIFFVILCVLFWSIKEYKNHTENYRK